MKVENHSYRIIPLIAADLYIKMQALTKSCINYYKTNLTKQQYNNLLFHCLRLNANTAKCFCINSDRTAYVTQLYNTYHTYIDFRNSLETPTANIQAQIKEIDTIFFKINKKYKSPKEKEDFTYDDYQPNL